MKARPITRGVLLAGALVFAAASAWALDIPPLKSRVTDLAGLLTTQQQIQLESKLEVYEQNTGHQFALLTIPSLEDEVLEDYSIRVVEQWRLGHKDRDDGLLLLIAVKERKVRIEVGYGLEGAIPDAFAGRVIRDVIAPHFRNGQQAEGIALAFDYLMRAAQGENVGLPTTQRRPQQKVSIVKLIFPIIIFALIFTTRMGWFLPLGLYGGMGRGGFGGGGFGGGFGGGGGGFGGGGASGGW